MSKPGRDRIRCCYLKPTDQVEVSLRVYDGFEKGASPCPPYGYHDARVVIERSTEAMLRDRGWPVNPEGRLIYTEKGVPADDPRWPKACRCGHQFPATAHRSADPLPLYRRSDNGELVTLDRAPIGAMWFAPWFSDDPAWRGPDGRTLVVRLPGRGGLHHDWIVDSVASNCTMKDDTVHKCWIRHGEPPNVTVDKKGHTCKAGAGSILTHEKWHGFLTDGYLVGRFEGDPAPAAVKPRKEQKPELRLVELEPRWIYKQKVFAFRCPHCRKTWLTCKRVPMSEKQQRAIFAQVFGEEGARHVPATKADFAWQFSGLDFRTMTVTPSINASGSGCWHGNIKAGLIV